MQRVRRQHQEAIAAAGRMALALLISAAFHLAVVTRWEVAASRPTPPSSLQARLHLEPVPPVVRAERSRVRERAPASAPEVSVAAVPASAAFAEGAVSATPDNVPSEGIAAQPAAPPTVQSAAAMEVPVDPVYYAARELDLYPMPLSPLTVAPSAEQGKVKLLTLIDETGAVAGTEVFDAEPMGRFEEQAAAIVSVTRFSPARKDGVPVRSRVLIELDFGP